MASVKLTAPSNQYHSDQKWHWLARGKRKKPGPEQKTANTISDCNMRCKRSCFSCLITSSPLLFSLSSVSSGTDWLSSVGLHFGLSPSLVNATCSSCCQALSKAQQPVIGLTQRLLPAQHRLLIKVQCVRCDFSTTSQFELIWDSWVSLCVC